MTWNELDILTAIALIFCTLNITLQKVVDFWMWANFGILIFILIIPDPVRMTSTIDIIMTFILLGVNVGWAGNSYSIYKRQKELDKLKKYVL